VWGTPGTGCGVAGYTGGVEVGRDVWSASGPSPLLKQGHLEPLPGTMSRHLLLSPKD